MPQLAHGLCLAAAPDLGTVTGYLPLVSEPAYLRAPGRAVHALGRLRAEFATTLAAAE